MAAPGKWKRYNKVALWLGDGTFDLDVPPAMKVGLYLSTSNANTLTNAVLADLTNEHANANGYTTGGTAVTATWTEAAGVATLDTTDAQWTASGGSIIARFAVLYLTGTFNGHVAPLWAVCLMDTAPADITVTTGNTLTIQMNASGIHTVSAGQVD